MPIHHIFPKLKDGLKMLQNGHIFVNQFPKGKKNISEKYCDISKEKKHIWLFVDYPEKRKNISEIVFRYF